MKIKKKIIVTIILIIYIFTLIPKKSLALSYSQVDKSALDKKVYNYVKALAEDEDYAGDIGNLGYQELENTTQFTYLIGGMPIIGTFSYEDGKFYFGTNINYGGENNYGSLDFFDYLTYSIYMPLIILQSLIEIENLDQTNDKMKEISSVVGDFYTEVFDRVLNIDLETFEDSNAAEYMNANFGYGSGTNAYGGYSFQSLEVLDTSGSYACVMQMYVNVESFDMEESDTNKITLNVGDRYLIKGSELGGYMKSGISCEADFIGGYVEVTAVKEGTDTLYLYIGSDTSATHVYSIEVVEGSSSRTNYLYNLDTGTLSYLSDLDVEDIENSGSNYSYEDYSYNNSTVNINNSSNTNLNTTKLNQGADPTDGTTSDALPKTGLSHNILIFGIATFVLISIICFIRIKKMKKDIE